MSVRACGCQQAAITVAPTDTVAVVVDNVAVFVFRVAVAVLFGGTVFFLTLMVSFLP